MKEVVNAILLGEVYTFYLEDAIDIIIDEAGISLYEFTPGKLIRASTALDKLQVIHNNAIIPQKWGRSPKKRGRSPFGERPLF